MRASNNQNPSSNQERESQQTVFEKYSRHTQRQSSSSLDKKDLNQSYHRISASIKEGKDTLSKAKDLRETLQRFQKTTSHSQDNIEEEVQGVQKTTENRKKSVEEMFEDQQSEQQNHSLIDRAFDKLNQESEANMQYEDSNNHYSTIQQSDSKIIHVEAEQIQMANGRNMYQVGGSVQNNRGERFQNQAPHNPSMQRQQVQFNSHQQQLNGQLRSTISGGEKGSQFHHHHQQRQQQQNAHYVSQQHRNDFRNSLPANMTAQQLVPNRQPNHMPISGQFNQQQQQQQHFNQHQHYQQHPQNRSQSPSFSGGHTNNSFNRPILPAQGNQLAVNNPINNNTLDFIRNGQGTLQKSEIVYQNRKSHQKQQIQHNRQGNNTALYGNINQNQYQSPQTHHAQFPQQSHPQATYKSRHHQQQSVNENRSRSGTYSNERRSSNVVFNFSSPQGMGSTPMRQGQGHTQTNATNNQLNRVGSQQQFAHPQMQQPHLNQQRQHQQSHSVSPATQPQPQPQQQQPRQTTLLTSAPVSENASEWKQRYFGLYERVVVFEEKIESIQNEFGVYQSLVNDYTSEQSLKNHSKLIYTLINETQQITTEIKYEWNPRKEQKGQNLASDSSSFSSEEKYKKLMASHQQLLAEHERVKGSFESKINSVVKKLQDENTRLNIKLKDLEEHYEKDVALLEKRQEDNEKLLGLLDEFEVTVKKLQVEKANLITELKQKQSRPYSIESQMMESSSFKESSSLHRGSFGNKIKKTTSSNYFPSGSNMSAGDVEGWVATMEEVIETIEKQNRNYEELEAKYIKFERQIKEKDEEIRRLQSLLHEIEDQQGSRRPSRNDINDTTRYQEEIYKISTQMTESISERSRLADKLALQIQKNAKLQISVERLEGKIEELERNQSGASNFNTSVTLELNQRIKELEQKNIELIERESMTSTQFNSWKNKGQSSGEVEQLRDENRKLVEENTELRRQIEGLHGTVQQLDERLTHEKVALQQQSRQQQNMTQSADMTVTNEIKAQYEFTISLLRSELQRKEEEIDRQAKMNDQRVIDITQQLKMAYQERQNLHKKYEEKILNLQKERDAKEVSIREFRDKIYEFEQKIRLLDMQNTRKNEYTAKMNSINQSESINNLKNQIQSLQKEKEREKKNLQSSIMTLEEQVTQLKKDNMKLKRQLSEFADTENQIESLNEVLSKKNLEIMELKDAAFESEKVAVENTNLNKELSRVESELVRVTAEYEKVVKNHSEVLKSSKEFESSVSMLNAQLISVRNEYNLMHEANDRKDHEIAKLRQANQLLQTNVNEVQRDLQRLKQKLKDNESNYERQRQSLLAERRNLQDKLTDFDRLIREKSVSEHRLSQLEASVQNYQYKVNEFEETVRNQKNKIKKYESDIEDLGLDKEEYRAKIDEADKQYSEGLKKYRKTIGELEEKNKSLKAQQIKYEKEKIASLENDVKSRDNKIWKLEKELEEIVERLDEVGDQELDQQKIFHLQQKIQEYESRLFNQTFKSSIGNYDYQATKVFERKVIYELKEENQRLREFISQKRNEKPTSDRNVVGKSSGVELQMRQQHEEELDEVQERLIAFDKRLDSLINNGEYQSVDNQKSQLREKSATKRNSARQYYGSQMKSKMSRQEQQNFDPLELLNREISSREARELQINYAQLQRYCKNIEMQLLTNQKSSISNYSLSQNNQQTIQSNNLAFYKEKNRELQERVDKLLKMNKELKESLDDLIQKGNDSSSVSYYKDQVLELNQKIAQLEGKLKRLLEENKHLKVTGQNSSQSGDANALKVIELEKRIIELQRSAGEFNLVKSGLERQIEELKADIDKKEYMVKDLRNQLEHTGQSQSEVVSAMKQKIESYEIEITKLENKLKINQSEIERLNEIIKKKQQQNGDESNRWKLKISQLNEEISQLNVEIQRQKQNQASYKNEISKLSQDLKAAQYQSSELKESLDVLNRKLQESQFRNRQLNDQIEILDGEILHSRGNESQWSGAVEANEVEIARLRNQVAILQAEIERLVDDSKSKVKSYEQQLASLQSKVSLAERQQLNLKKSTSSYEVSKQAYDAEIAQLKNKVALFSAEIERLNGQFSSKDRVSEERISQLKSQITQLEGNSEALTQSRDSWQLSKDRYENQIAQLKGQIEQLHEQLYQMNETAILKEQEVRSMKEELSRWLQEKESFEVQITKLHQQKTFLSDEIERLNQKIRSHETSVSNSQLTSTSELNQLRREKDELSLHVSQVRQELGLELEEFKRQLLKIGAEFKNILYFVELQRSIYLEVETLLAEESIRGENEMIAVKKRVSEEIYRGLEVTSRVNELMNGLLRIEG